MGFVFKILRLIKQFKADYFEFAILLMVER